MSYDLGTAHGKITLDYDGEGAVREAERDIDKLERKAKEGDASIGKLGKTLGLLGSGLKITGLVAGLTNAAISASALGIQLLGMVPQLLSIISLSAALPGLYVAAGVALGVMKAALAGVGDAVTAAFDTEHPEKFEKALKELSPEAQKFALAIKDAVPILKGFQQELQESFFQASALTGQVPRLLKALGQLRPTLLGLAQDFGDITRRVTNFALSADSIRFVDNAVKAFRAGLSEASRAIIPVLSGLRAVGSVGLPLLARLGEAIGNVGERFGAWLTDIAADGRLQTWINTAIETLRTLGDIVGNIGSILNSVLTAANETGGGLLNTIAEVTGQFAAFLKTAEGSAAIRSLFSGIMELARQLAPIFTTLVKVVAGALGPALQKIATDIGPVLLDVVNKLAQAFGPLVAAATNLLSAIAPLLPPLAQLVALFAGVLATAINAIVLELGPLISIIAGALTKAFEEFTPLIAEMAKGLPVAAEAGIGLAQAFAPLIPVILELAKALAGSLTAAMPQLIDAARDLVPIFVEFAKAMAGQLLIALQQIIPMIPLLVEAFIRLAPILAQITLYGLRLVTWALQFGVALRGLITTVQQFVGQFVGMLLNALTTAYNFVVTNGSRIIDWFVQLPERIMSAIKAFPKMISDFFKRTLDGLATLAGFALGLLVGSFTVLPGRIMAAVSSLAGSLKTFFSNLWNSIRNGAVTAWNNMISFFAGLPKRIRGALNSLGSLLSSLAKSAWNAVKNAFTAGANTVLSTTRALPGRIRSALGNMGSLLLSAGRSIIQGLINGISSMIGRVMSMVSNLAARVRNAFNSALSIFSPSRDFFASGVNIGKGLILGLKDQLSNVARMGQLLASTVIQPTVLLPATAGAAALSVGMNTTRPTANATDEKRTFGPYQLELDGGVVTEFVINAVTGHPTVVSKAAAEGNRRKSWNGKGS